MSRHKVRFSVFICYKIFINLTSYFYSFDVFVNLSVHVSNFILTWHTVHFNPTLPDASAFFNSIPTDGPSREKDFGVGYGSPLNHIQGNVIFMSF